MRAAPHVADQPSRRVRPLLIVRRISSVQWVGIAMILGVALGYAFPDGRAGRFHASDLQLLSTLFLRMIESVIAPLLFATLVVGIAGHGRDTKQVGALALRSLLYFEVVTTLAMIVGLIVVNLVQPGVGVDLARASADAGAQLVQTKVSIGSLLEHAIPRSVIEAAFKNEALQIVFFSVLFGVGLAQLEGNAKKVMLGFCESLSEVMFKYVGFVMKFAPFGIAGAIAATIGRSGLGVLGKLLVLVFTLYGALIVFVAVVLLPIAALFRVPIRSFWGAVREPWVIAFSTASSEAALPLALRNLEELGVPRRIVSFVLPAGYSFNMDGTSLYLALASVFVAQAAGVHMPVAQQVLMMLTLMLTSKGVAGVPRAGLVVLSGALTQFGLPLQGVAVILGVDALMDMARTSLNVLGNCLAAAVMARCEGSFPVPAADRSGRPSALLRLTDSA